MSAVAGFANYDHDNRSSAADDRERLEMMCARLRHRGPFTNSHVERGVALGACHRDNSNASTHDGATSTVQTHTAVALAGDITNAPDVHSDLLAKGYRFPFSVDRTVAVGYDVWGEGVFARLEGHFALALWNARTRTLLVARDRVGTKPLYYGSTRDRLFFASEAKCLLANSEIDRQLDPGALDHYLAYLLMPRDQSIFRSIQKLLPGHYLKLDNGVLTRHRYWTLPTADAFEGTETTAADALSALLDQCVQMYASRTSDAGLLLSGGLNSNLLAAVLTRAGVPVTTVAAAFTATDPDAHSARKVAAHLGTTHREVVIEPDASAILDQLISHFDEPFGDPSAIPTWYLAHAVRDLGAVMSGHGADEIFGGCERYVPPSKVAAFDRIAGRPGRRIAAVVAAVLPEHARGRNFIRHVAQSPRARYLDAMTFYRRDARRSLLAPGLVAGLEDSIAEARFAEPFNAVSHLSWPRQMMAFDFETDLPDDVLTKIDRAAAAHQVEWRLPFLDVRLVDFAAALPDPLRVRNHELKPVLRAVARRYLPEDIVRHPKTGFGLEVARWFQRPVREVFEDVLRSADTRQRGYFNQSAIDRLLHDHATGTQDHSVRLWQLLVFELWHRQHVDAPAMAA